MVTRINGIKGVSNNLGVFSGATEEGLLQTVMTSSGPERYTWATTTPQPCPDLSIDFTPLRGDSLILIYVDLSVTRSFVNSWAIYKDGLPTADTTGFTNTNGPDMNFTGYLGTYDTSQIYPHSLIWSENSGSTATRNYEVYGLASWSTRTDIIYVNDRSSDDMACYSSMTVMEIYNA